MKKMSLLILFLTVFMLGTMDVFSQHDNLQNVSADFMRTGGRNAAYDGADIVVYNPAGLMRMENGFHINLGNQSFFRAPNHSFDLGFGQGPQKYQQDGANWVLPNLFAALKKDKWAAFGGIYVSGGGGTMNYPEGSINTELIEAKLLANPPPFGYQGVYTNGKNSLEGSSYYITPTIGASFKINDAFSAGLSLKYLLATNKQKAQIILTNSPVSAPDLPLNFESVDKANGYGATLSLNYKVSDKLNIGLRYESKVKLEFETDSIEDDFRMIREGKKSRRDLPAFVAFGANYDLNDTWNILLDVNWFFQTGAEWDTNSMGISWSEIAGNVGRFGAGIGYKSGEKLTANFYLGYTLYMYDNMEEYYTRLGTFEVIKSNNLTFGLGALYKLNETLGISLAVVETFWTKDNIVAREINKTPLIKKDVTTNNRVTTVAIGANIFLK